jgi:hypothetical protein
VRRGDETPAGYRRAARGLVAGGADAILKRQVDQFKPIIKDMKIEG